MKRTIKALKIPCNGQLPELVEIPDELEVYQEFVDGCIECVRINARLFMVVNDEGLIRELPENLIATFLYWSINGQPVTPICGNAILVGVDPENGEFCNIPTAAAMSVIKLSRYLRCLKTSEDTGARYE